MIIDFSAHDTFQTCPALWYEKYINKRRKRWPKAQREDALCLGSLVHEGLRVWQTSHTVEIPQAVIDEMTPTRECLNLAHELVYGYAQRYPSEYWPLVMCEEPLTAPLMQICKACGDPGGDSGNHVCFGAAIEDLTLLAKIDAYFYVPEPTLIESGVPGIQYTLQPGWYIHEYKTKSPYISMGIYMQGWEMALQASYQTMALNYHLQTRMGLRNESVQGVLVNVLEKPKRYIPKRKCKSCQENYEFATWLPTGTGLYACPVCGNRQKLTPLTQATPVVPPEYYRLVVTRTAEQLKLDREHIMQTGQAMISMAQNGLTSLPWHKKNCVDTKWNRACDYFQNHLTGTPTTDDPGFEEVPDYRGLIQIEEIAA